MACETIPALPIGLPGDIPGCCVPVSPCCDPSVYEGSTLTVVVTENTNYTSTYNGVSGTTNYGGTMEVTLTYQGNQSWSGHGFKWNGEYQDYDDFYASVSCSEVNGQPVYSWNIIRNYYPLEPSYGPGSMYGGCADGPNESKSNECTSSNWSMHGSIFTCDPCATDDYGNCITYSGSWSSSRTVSLG